jgi:ketosteroid isomerase-like protein
MLKKLWLPEITFLLLSGLWSCQEQVVDIEAEKEAIRQVVQSQLDAVKALSFEGEAESWAHTPYIVRKDIAGWDSISVFYQEMFSDVKNDTGLTQVSVFTASNFDIYINGNFASVFHDEHFEGTWKGEEMSSDGRPHKYMEKIEGEWKLITLF